MNIGIIDAEIIGRKKHRFPNLACMKISSYHKSLGDNVNLLLSYNDLDKYDKVYISKVFCKTPILNDDTEDVTEQNVIQHYKDNSLLHRSNISYGGTGFFYDKAPPLKYEIEHCKPDYGLYKEWVNSCIKKV